MTQLDRRKLLALGAATLALPAAIQKAWAIDAKSMTGTIEDVKHVVILMQENRSFDHYFGTMSGVRGFGDRFPLPLAGGSTVWRQNHSKAAPPVIAPFSLNTAKNPALMRIEGTPHSWADAQYAWDNGRMTNWPDHKRPHAMGYYEAGDIPFQWALANAFTLCDAYHCSFPGGTNTNRLFHWTGTNDGDGTRGGPSISNSHDTLPDKEPLAQLPYTWTTYPERLEQAGVSWKIYEDMADNFGDNPLVGFKAFRDSLAGAGNPALAAKGLATQHLDVLLADVLAGKLPSVSWVISPAKDSEHPGPSSPAQGADYVARVLDALTANPEIWARTVLLVNYDENDGFFDHVPPPAPPSRDASGQLLGASTVDTAGEYHLVRAASEKTSERDDLMGRPYGLGPRVPMFVVSPFARGGFVNSEVFDHTSVIRFLERRFGVVEPNISAWRRAICGDLMSCFDFKAPNAALANLPGTADGAAKAAGLPGRTTPPTPADLPTLAQAVGLKRSRPLPYTLDVALVTGPAARLEFVNRGAAGAVLHVHDLKRPGVEPRRFTVEGQKSLIGEWPAGAYDLFVLGPNGFHRRYRGEGAGVSMSFGAVGRKARLSLSNMSDRRQFASAVAGAYEKEIPEIKVAEIPPGEAREFVWDFSPTSGWYDLKVKVGDFEHRLAGRIDDGSATTSDPAMGGPAQMSWS